MDEDEERRRRRKERKRLRKLAEAGLEGETTEPAEAEEEAPQEADQRKADKKRRRAEREAAAAEDEVAAEDADGATDTDAAAEAAAEAARERKRAKRAKKALKAALASDSPSATSASSSFASTTTSASCSTCISRECLRHICAPMVGGSELAFRLLCRRYGTTLAYTPMINSARFAVDAAYREQEFQSCPEDRPLVCHFSANDASLLVQAARHVESHCDAIDINLGCPQRVAFQGHYGSFLLDEVDRPLVLGMVQALSAAVSVPVFCKIRLLDTLEATVELCRQLASAGASLIAIHARHRVNLSLRTGPGAREGAALLDWVTAVVQALRQSHPSVLIVTNGNVREWSDVAANAASTGADGVMCAEALLDNPALFLPSPRLGTATATASASASATTSAVATTVHRGGGGSGSGSGSDKGSSGSSGINSADGGYPSKIQLANEYLLLSSRHPVKLKSVIFHLRRILRDELTSHQLMDDLVGSGSSAAVAAVLARLGRYLSGEEGFSFDVHKAAKEKEALERRKREEGKRREFEARMQRKARREGLHPLHYLHCEAPSADQVQEYKAMIASDGPGSDQPAAASAPAKGGPKSATDKDKKKEQEKDKEKEQDGASKGKGEGKGKGKEAAFALWKARHPQHCWEFHFNPAGCHRDRTCSFLHADASFAADAADAFG